MSESITYARLRQLLDAGVQLVDVLSARAYRKQHLPGAINIPLNALDERTTAHLDRNRPVAVYCHDGL